MKKHILLITACLVSLNSHAAFSCDVKINDILIYGDGSVNVKHTGRNDYTYICNVNTVRLNIGVSTCAMWTGLLMQVKKKNGTAQFYYEGTTSCSALPTYSSSPAPWYIGDVTPNL